MFLDLQINYLLWLQNIRESLNGFFDPFFLSVSLFGSFILPICVITFIYWSLNKRAGEFLIISAAFGLLCNQFAKMAVCINRPWILSDKIKPVADAIPAASGYSFPSGHTAKAMSLWGGLAVLLWDNKKVRYTLITLILLVAFSRNYLGVHTPQDVLFSIFIGIIILLIIKKVFDKIDDKNNDIKILVTGIVGVFAAVCMVIVKYNIMQGQELAGFVKQMPHFYFNVGYVLGAVSGWFLCRKYIPFSTDNMHWFHRLFRFIPGIIFTLTLVLYEVPSLEQYLGKCKGSFMGAIVAGLFVTFIYPWVFTRFERRFKK